MADSATACPRPGSPRLPVPEAARAAEAIAAAVEASLAGKPDAIRTAVTVLLAGGHLLVEDVPGVGKTMLAKALAAAIGGTMHRIQFTPDLMPGDVTGVSVYNQRTGEFQFRPGGIFANVVLGDEVNRASPKTQSAMLEAMAEHQVSVDGTTYELPDPFLVVATQNPLEMEGTYPLPEAQRDRFMARLALGYPDAAAEVAMLGMHDGKPLSPSVVSTPDQVRAITTSIRAVHTSDLLRRFAVDLVSSTREHRDLRLGASPRATLHLVQAARARALVDGRDHVLPDDIIDLAVPVLAHRVLPTAEAAAVGPSPEQVVAAIAAQVPIPHPTSWS